EDLAEVELRAARRRPVVVGQVEVSDAELERARDDVAHDGERLVLTEVLPQAERDGRKLETAAAAPAVTGLRGSAVGGVGYWFHGCLLGLGCSLAGHSEGAPIIGRPREAASGSRPRPPAPPRRGASAACRPAPLGARRSGPRGWPAWC